MSQPQPTSILAYVEYHTGPKRTLTMHLTSGNPAVIARHSPVVSIDGRRYIVFWGAVTFEVPADRNVHVSVHLEADFLSQVASMVVPPGQEPVAFAYETHYTAGAGSLRPVAAL